MTHRAGKVYATSYGYDAADRLTTVTDWLGKATTYGYDDAGRLTGIAYPNGVAATYGYDPAGRLASVAHARGATTLASVAYTRDAAGNPTQVTETGVPLPGTTAYTYDALHRLTSAAYPDGSTAGWGYDAVGNRTSITQGGVTTTAAYDAANRLTSQGAATYGYDNNGNRTSRAEGNKATTYAYDAENRLTRVQGPGNLDVALAYDGDGYLARRSAGKATSTYAWDRLGAGGLGTILADGQGEYVHGPAGLQQRVALDTTAPQYAHGDGLGSLRLVTDAAGAAVGGRGDLRAVGDTAHRLGHARRLRLHRELTDSDTGLVYLRARHYDPAAGRFLQEDSYGGTHKDGRPAPVRLRGD